MAFKQFSEVQYIRAIDTDETLKLGSFQMQNNTELEHMRLQIYIEGSLGGSELIRTNIYSNAGGSKLMFTSSWSTVADIVDETGATISGNWLGLVRTDFNRQNLNKNLIYYPSIELSNYTRNGDTFYIGACVDYPNPRYSAGSSHYNANLAFEIFEYRNF